MKVWWQGAVVYQIYPRSFQDHNGDGIGDLAGIISRLPYIASLGVDAIWLSPIFTSPMADMGYDVSDYCDVDPLFGDLADFDQLIATANDLGLKVIIDQVISHTSDQHPWFKEARSSKDSHKKDWYVWADAKADGCPPNNWVSVFGGPAWEWDTRHRQYYLHNFLTSQPDLNVHNPEVQDALLDTMRFWLERGVDGFRLDTVNYYMHDLQLRDNPPESYTQTPLNTYDFQDHIYSKTRPENLAFIERIRALMDEFDERTLIGEVGEGRRCIDVMADYTKGDKRLHMAYSFGMLSPDFSVAHFRNQVEDFFAKAPDAWPSWSFSNHDVQRHVSRWLDASESVDTVAKQAIAMLVSFPGSFGIYQGEELGMQETVMEYHELTDPPGIRFWPEQKGRDGCRTPMVWDDSEYAGFSQAKPWLPVKAPQLAVNVASQEEDSASVLNYYRQALAMRKQLPSLHQRDFKFLDTQEPVLALIRGQGKEALLCAFNLSNQSERISVAGLGELLPLSRCADVDGEVLTLGPNGVAFIPTAAMDKPFALLK